MNLSDRDLIKQLDAKYIKQVGIGQYSFYRFADFIIETQPELTRRLLSDVLKKELTNIEGKDNVDLLRNNRNKLFLKEIQRNLTEEP